MYFTNSAVTVPFSIFLGENQAPRKMMMMMMLMMMVMMMMTTSLRRIMIIDQTVSVRGEEKHQNLLLEDRPPEHRQQIKSLER